MTIKIKTCADDNCLKEFRPFLSTQKYCSASCTYKNKKPAKPRQVIRQKSKKQATLDRAYSVLRRTFLNKPENKYCPVFPKLEASEIHHKAGRVGALFLHVPFWLAVSRKGHVWIHNNPKEAYKKGFLIKSTTV